MFIYDPATGKSETLGTVSEGYNVYDMAFHAGKTYMIGYAGAYSIEDEGLDHNPTDEIKAALSLLRQWLAAPLPSSRSSE